LIRGTLGGREILALSGRFHMYEGHDAKAAAFPIRVVHALGAKVLFVSNAAGLDWKTALTWDPAVLDVLDQALQDAPKALDGPGREGC
jgi:purine nucleoside phosphorylase